LNLNLQPDITRAVWIDDDSERVSRISQLNFAATFELRAFSSVRAAVNGVEVNWVPSVAFLDVANNTGDAAHLQSALGERLFDDTTFVLVSDLARSVPRSARLSCCVSSEIFDCSDQDLARVVVDIFAEVMAARVPPSRAFIRFMAHSVGQELSAARSELFHIRSASIADSSDSLARMEKLERRLEKLSVVEKTLRLQ
jgi:hypothetical protein